MAGQAPGSVGSVGNIAPSYANDDTDTVAASLIDDGATGFVSVVEPFSNRGGVQAMKVTLNSDRSQATVQVGSNSYTLDTGVGYSVSGGTYASSSSTSAPIIGIANNDDYSVITYSDASGLMVFGYVGIETPTAGLPTGSVNYSGDWSTNIWPKSMAGSPDVALGDLSMDIDFASGDITGTLEESLTTVGTITGSVDDSRVSGTFDMTGTTHTGSLDFEGALYGDTAESVAGAFHGTVSDGTDDFHSTGIFDADR